MSCLPAAAVTEAEFVDELMVECVDGLPVISFSLQLMFKKRSDLLERAFKMKWLPKRSDLYICKMP
jgi:hypothetical protein